MANVPTAPEIAPVAISARAGQKARPVAIHLGVKPREGQAHGHRFGMDPVGAADADGEFMFLRPRFQGVEQTRRDPARRRSAARVS